MKILVLSDSHSALSIMRRAIEAVKPDAIIHLGDYQRDWEAIAEDYPGIPAYSVPGNCDRYRDFSGAPEVMVPRIDGVDIFMTHGHLHGVKTYLGKLVQDARAANAAVALYGHTHEAYCQQEEDGLWVMNPGTCGCYGGSVGLVETDRGRVTACRILRDGDLEAME